MSVELHELYQQVILDHNRSPRNVRVIEGGRRGERSNPICGDRVTVHLQVEGDVIRDASFQASACAIVKASASLMTESVKARTVADARALADRFRRMITAPPGAPIDDLGPLYRAGRCPAVSGAGQVCDPALGGAAGRSANIRRRDVGARVEP